MKETGLKKCVSRAFEESPEIDNPDELLSCHLCDRVEVLRKLARIPLSHFARRCHVVRNLHAAWNKLSVHNRFQKEIIDAGDMAKQFVGRFARESGR